jgi:hypothetical protein
MKISAFFAFAAFAPLCLLPFAGLAEDRTLTIQHGEIRQPDYQVESGTEELASEPVAGLKESYDSWKKACADWKKEMREMNGSSLISLSCGKPKATRDSSSRVTQESVATYKIKVKVRERAAEKPAEKNAE